MVLLVAVAVDVLCLMRLVDGVRIISASCEPMASCDVDNREWFIGSSAGQGAHAGLPDPGSVSGLFSVGRGLIEPVSEHEVGREWSGERPGTRVNFF